jgi:CheY-like chemotaxis protein
MKVVCLENRVTVTAGFYSSMQRRALLSLAIDPLSDDLDSRFKLFHKLMAKKVKRILLVSTPYDAWIMEEDCRLSERIINEYRGLNLSQPPILTWVSSAEEALGAVERRDFDMVITMPRLADMDAYSLGRKIKAKVADLPVILLSHGDLIAKKDYAGRITPQGIDRAFVWSGNTDILVAIIKSTEDRMNIEADARIAGIRVILFIEDSPAYLSSLLPILYRELVCQTQAVMEEGLNEEHRLLTMRARPKILVTDNYEEAVTLFEQFESNVLGVISDVRFSRDGRADKDAGMALLSRIKKDHFDIPLLLTSAFAENARLAAQIPAAFVDKKSPSLIAEVRAFFKQYLGFGDFVFRMPDGSEISRASNMRTLEEGLCGIPDASFEFHTRRNDFSRWFFARTETELAETVRPIRGRDFPDVASHRDFLITTIRSRRKQRQKGIVVKFDAQEFDHDTEFFRIGSGSIGGKARGLAFIASLLKRNHKIHERFDVTDIIVPQTLVITTEGFEDFVENNDLRHLSKADLPDEKIAEAFVAAEFPQWMADDLAAYLAKVDYPLAIRSSSLLEDAQFRAYAGLYRTYMIANDHPDPTTRLDHLIQAIKLVYASTYYQAPKSFSKRVGHRTEEEQMAVIIQRLVGEQYHNYFYPAISGVAQSHNYYPFGHMKPDEGIATIALGLGKVVVEGEKTLRFSPKYPQLLPQHSTVEDILENSQRHFYCLKKEAGCHPLGSNEEAGLERREVSNAIEETPMKVLASTYVPEEHRIRDTSLIPGHKVLTFAHVLKYKEYPLPELLTEALAMGQKGMGCPVEIEFSVNLCRDAHCRPQFAFLQIRPMTARAELLKVDISQPEIDKAFCYSSRALGNARRDEMFDIIYVRPDRFDPSLTPRIAQEIGKLNARLMNQGHRYLLVGPGRWGSADRWLGIPVTWNDISGVGAIVETASEKLRAEPSQGSHFFHNITTLGINYITVESGGEDFFHWDWLTGLPLHGEDEHVAHVRLANPIILKVDGRHTRCVMYLDTS